MMIQGVFVVLLVVVISPVVWAKLGSGIVSVSEGHGVCKKSEDCVMIPKG